MIQENSRRQKKYYGIIILSVSLSLFYIALIDGFSALFPFINGFFIGIIIGILFVFFEFSLYTKYIKRLKFIQILIIRSMYYLIVISGTIFIELIVARMIRDKSSFKVVFSSNEFQEYLFSDNYKYAILYAFILIICFNFIRQMNLKIGQGNFFNFILGRYVKPVIQERIFMFVKIHTPESKTHSISDTLYFTLLNDIIYDITEEIIIHYGEIYEYVDDTFVISWNPARGIKNANCIRAYFNAQFKLKEEKSKYFDKYGFSPRISAALHIGDAIRGELGDVKSIIVFSGEVMNITSRILEQCSLLDSSFLVSDSLLKRMRLPEIYSSMDCGFQELRGKADSIQLFSIYEKEFQYV
jgi:adenylate cyclase